MSAHGRGQFCLPRDGWFRQGLLQKTEIVKFNKYYERLLLNVNIDFFSEICYIKLIGEDCKLKSWDAERRSRL